MEKTFFGRWKRILAAGVLVIFGFGLGAALTIQAFVGPGSLTSGSGNGAIGSDSSSNVSFGTSTTNSATKVLVVASSTADTGNYALKILDKNQNPLFLVRNDGSLAVGTSSFNASTILTVQGNIYATGNITCGGSCGGGGGLSGGQANYIPVWTGASSEGTSTLIQNGTTTYTLNGIAIGTSTLQPAGTLYATGGITANSFSGSLTANWVAAGNFASSTGAGNFSFPGSLGIATTTNVSLPASLSLYGNMLVTATATFSGAVILPVNQALSVSGQITIETTTSSLNFYDGTTQQALSPIKALPFTLENPTASEDDSILIFNANSAITKVYAVNKTDGDTVTFNIIWASSRATASASAQHLFASNQAVTATTTPASFTSFASSTVNAGSVMRFITSAASSSQFTFTLFYRDLP